MSTSIEAEIEAASTWTLNRKYRGPRFDKLLLKNEFISSDEHQFAQSKALNKLLEHCFNFVPYYRTLFSNQGITEDQLRDPEILKSISPLDKGHVTDNTKLLLSEHLPQGHTLAGTTQSSGTTGQPTVIRHSRPSLAMFQWLKQRELRWHRYNPMGSWASIRPFIELPKIRPDHSYLKDGQALRLSAWPYFTRLFNTGPFLGFNNTNSVEAQVRFLEQVKPDYLLMQASCLEHLSMQNISPLVTDQLKGAQSVSQTLTPKMRALIEGSLKTPVHQNYGLNEIGLVASRCQEGGRYHIHREHCIVEIVRSDGTDCEPGERGKLLVTSLTNFAMPLIRYDADDLAEVVDGPCPCGRTLPSFGAVQGRYRRMAHLPEGTLKRWGAIQFALHILPSELKSTVRRYQAIQDSQGHLNCGLIVQKTLLQRYLLI